MQALIHDDKPAQVTYQNYKPVNGNYLEKGRFLLPMTVCKTAFSLFYRHKGAEVYLCAGCLQIVFDQGFSDLNAVRCRPFTYVIRHHPHIQAVGMRNIITPATLSLAWHPPACGFPDGWLHRVRKKPARAQQ